MVLARDELAEIKELFRVVTDAARDDEAFVDVKLTFDIVDAKEELFVTTVDESVVTLLASEEEVVVNVTSTVDILEANEALLF